MDTPISNNPNFVGFQQIGQTPSSTVFTPPPSPRKVATKSVIAGGILILVLVSLILGFSRARHFLSQAEGSCSPENLEEANLTANSVEITFKTDKACLTEVSYGTSSDALLLKVPEERIALNHRFKLSPLLPSTTYYYQVSVEGRKVGTVRSFLTKKAVVSETPTPTFVTTEVPSLTSYTLGDFVKQYGTANAEFDFDKNGVVNSSDWLEYQKAR